MVPCVYCQLTQKYSNLSKFHLFYVLILTRTGLITKNYRFIESKLSPESYPESFSIKFGGLIPQQ
jgi:hypothetical protein